MEEELLEEWLVCRINNDGDINVEHKSWTQEEAVNWGKSKARMTGGIYYVIPAIVAVD